MRHTLTLPNKQKGMTLMVAMITLVVLMLLGLGAMTASNTMFKLAGNLQFQNEAKNRAESALIKAETWLVASVGTTPNSTNAGFTTTAAPYYAPGTTLSPLTSWPNAASAPATGEQFIIQRITSTQVVPPGYTICFPQPCQTTLPPKYHLYRVIARGQSSRGAVRYVESIMQVP